jgi:transposase-like protein
LAVLAKVGAVEEDVRPKERESGSPARPSRSEAPKRGVRPDGLGIAGYERVKGQGCPHCAGCEVVAWGEANGLARFRCKGCRRTFNALTKTPMARLRKKDRWLDYVQAMIEGRSLLKTAELCGVHPSTAFRWRHRFLSSPAADKPSTLSGIVEADETFVLESFKGASGLTFRARPASEADWPAIRAQESNPHSRGARPKGRDLRRGPASGRQRLNRRGAGGGRHAEQPSRVRRRVGDRRFCAQGQDPLHAVPAPGKPAPEAPHLHINNVNGYHCAEHEGTGFLRLDFDRARGFSHRPQPASRLGGHTASCR